MRSETLPLSLYDRERLLTALTRLRLAKPGKLPKTMSLLTWATATLENRWRKKRPAYAPQKPTSTSAPTRQALRRLLCPKPWEIEKGQANLTANTRLMLEELFGCPLEEVLWSYTFTDRQTLNSFGVSTSEVLDAMDRVDDEIAKGDFAGAYDVSHRLDKNERRLLIEKESRSAILMVEFIEGRPNIVGYSLQVALKSELWPLVCRGDFPEQTFCFKRHAEVMMPKAFAGGRIFKLYVFDVVAVPRFFDRPGLVLFNYLNDRINTWIKKDHIPIERMAGCATSFHGDRLSEMFGMEAISRYCDATVTGWIFEGGVPFEAKSKTKRVAAPVRFSPDSGRHPRNTKIELQTATDGAIVHYEIGGKTPTEASPKYTKPLMLCANQTIKAVAFKPGRVPSPVTSAQFTIEKPRKHTRIHGSGPRRG